jgi:hypothetical protein
MTIYKIKDSEKSMALVKKYGYFSIKDIIGLLVLYGEVVDDAEIEKLFEQGYILFSISTTVKAREILPYYDAGFTVIFARAKDYKEFCKRRMSL